MELENGNLIWHCLCWLITKQVECDDCNIFINGACVFVVERTGAWRYYSTHKDQPMTIISS